MPSMNGNGSPPPSGRAYWRSLDEMADTPEFRQFMHHEFPAGAAELLDSADRRQFLRIMAASMALAGMGIGGCRRWPAETIAPYANRPSGRTPGATVQYATSMSLGGAVSGLLATSVDGRPVKLEPNTQHPAGKGTTAFAQASILDLYDPDRSRSVRHDGADASWSQLVADLGPRLQALRTRQGAGLHILSEGSSSPSIADMKRRLVQACPRAAWHEYEPLNDDNERRGTEILYGVPLRPHYQFAHARTIVSLDADFMFDHADAVRHIRDFADRRREPGLDTWEHLGAGQRMTHLIDGTNRLYAFESGLSLTGANADERAAMRSADVSAVAIHLAASILNDPALQQLAQLPAVTAALTGEVRAVLDRAVADLQGAARQSMVVAGRGQPPEVHMLAHAINFALGNVATADTPELPVAYTSSPGGSTAGSHVESIRTLAAALDAGQVDTVVILGGNPVYNAPADLDFATKLAKAGVSVHLADYVDETSQDCTWHVNRAHFLESWGDERAWDGTLGVSQPVILPLFGGRSAVELLALVAGDELREGQQIVERTFGELVGASDNDARWRRTLHDGHMRGTAATLHAPVVQRDGVQRVADSLQARLSAPDRDGLEVVFTADHSVWDGRFANNGWLQELPDPLTKITWDNAALMGPATAASLGIERGDLVQITAGGRSVQAAAFIVPGHAENSVTLPLGYGRRFEGRVCNGAGFDFYGLRSSTAMGHATGATLQKSGGRYTLATTQDHHAIDIDNVGGQGIQERLPTLFREADLKEYAEQPDFAHHRTHVVTRLSMWDDQEATAGADYAWGMSIDLNACVGCNACIIACQAENNIPIVGKDQVTRGREMHWLRIDRYFAFEQDADGHPMPDRLRNVAMQPVACQHCETAPCEQVCPVAATVHDKEGLNVMVYNRCIGTRYCSNNCPYKVRRFNYFDFHRREPHRQPPGALLAVDANYYTKPQAGEDPLRQMQMNPEVSIRVRGVMEKCTFCTQRIQAAKIKAKNDWVNLPADDPRRQDTRVPLEDGAIQTACQEACPAAAIVFGDLNDPASRVARLHQHQRSYEMLEEINTKPRTRYLARLRNPAHQRPSLGGGGH